MAFISACLSMPHQFCTVYIFKKLFHEHPVTLQLLHIGKKGRKSTKNEQVNKKILTHSK